MKKYLIPTVLSAFLIGIGLVSTLSLPVGAATAQTIQEGVNNVGGGGGIDLKTGITTTINLLLFLIGTIAVIMIIIGGIRYVLSNGEQGNITSAKNTILYAVIGLIVAIMAFAIVQFITRTFK